MIKNKFINDLSFIKLTGKKSFLMLDIHSDFLVMNLLNRNERFYNLKKSGDIWNYKVINTSVEVIDGDYLKISDAVKRFLNQYEIKEITTVIGINEFKLEFISLPADNEDAGLWFEENCDKFLPAGRPREEFRFSFEQYSEDENYKYYFVVIARNDYISRITSACSIKGLNIISVFPFIVSTIGEAVKSGNDLLAINVLRDKTVYLFASGRKNVVYNEIYADNYSICAKDSFIPPGQDFELNITGLESAFLQIIQNLKLLINDIPDRLKVIKENWRGDYIPASQTLSKYISIEDAFPDVNPGNSVSMLSLLSLKKIIRDFNTGINLLPPEKIEDEREEMEKGISLRTVLAGGIILIILLMLINAADYYISNVIEGNEEKVSAITLEEEQIKKFDERNKLLKENLVRLIDLKRNRQGYTDLFYSLSGVVEGNSFLTGAEINTAGTDNPSVTITGYSLSQQEIAEIISNLENTKEYSNVRLLNASAKDINRNRDTLVADNYLQFKISFDYDADKK